MTTFIDFHALHTLAPSNVNRGEDGSPKSAFFGGVQRQRISSQALKAAQRKAFSNYLDSSELGVRTKRIVELVARRMTQIDPDIDLDDALAAAGQAMEKAGFKLTSPKVKKGEDVKPPTAGYLVFLGEHQVERLARLLLETEDVKALTKKDVHTVLDTEHAIDVALFGRMVADDAALNVDASAQVAHALGVHAAVPDFDYYTAVDDMSRADEETGAGMIGTIEMVSSTMYRYATVNVDQLMANLGSRAAVKRALEAFASTFIEALPSGKQNTFAAHTLPEVVAVAVRDRRPVSYANAFETAIEADSGQNRRKLAARSLASEASAVAETYGLSPLDEWVAAVPSLQDDVEGLGDKVNTRELIENLLEALDSALPADATAGRDGE
ncbi:type I-E CRISPR-associated protein Cas7/Cse4/CasC [Flaviflexus huanghaiensis]|uniref:type I-E CRISPR-associated protein Cas7/Cse4/CasC n=1 Tax=Flaviflexus huanghaiensis TaxID=1111473 RepID=UPI0015FB7A86|nr:type I-E CRISPR-associated protein Cas7/Cse4/CasC [Flaviflexus huanghaiensis]